MRVVSYGLIGGTVSSPGREAKGGLSKIRRVPAGSSAFFLVILLLAGCAHERPAQFDPAAFRSPGLERCLQYWVAHFSLHSTNHFYVYPTEVDRGELARALVFWREGGRIMDYLEMPRGAEAQAWRLRPKVDRDTVLTDERIGISNDMVPHRMWVRLMKQCITRGREYVVSLKQARAAFRQANNTSP